MDIEIYIRKYAKWKRVKPEDFPAFREKVLEGLKKMGLATDSIDIDKYKEMVKDGTNKKV